MVAETITPATRKMTEVTKTYGGRHVQRLYGTLQLIAPCGYSEEELYPLSKRQAQLFASGYAESVSSQKMGRRFEMRLRRILNQRFPESNENITEVILGEGIHEENC